LQRQTIFALEKTKPDSTRPVDGHNPMSNSETHRYLLAVIILSNYPNDILVVSFSPERVDNTEQSSRWDWLYISTPQMPN